jgi:hypothetical protein
MHQVFMPTNNNRELLYPTDGNFSVVMVPTTHFSAMKGKISRKGQFVAEDIPVNWFCRIRSIKQSKTEVAMLYNEKYAVVLTWTSICLYLIDERNWYKETGVFFH